MGLKCSTHKQRNICTSAAFALPSHQNNLPDASQHKCSAQWRANAQTYITTSESEREPSKWPNGRRKRKSESYPMTDSTYDESRVRISCSEVVCSHYCISPSLKMASLTGQCWELPCRVHERTVPRGSTGMAEVKSINTRQLVFWPLNKTGHFSVSRGKNNLQLEGQRTKISENSP